MFFVLLYAHMNDGRDNGMIGLSKQLRPSSATAQRSASTLPQPNVKQVPRLRPTVSSATLGTPIQQHISATLSKDVTLRVARTLVHWFEGAPQDVILSRMAWEPNGAALWIHGIRHAETKL